jgi:hypothetical protein
MVYAPFYAVPGHTEISRGKAPAALHSTQKCLDFANRTTEKIFVDDSAGTVNGYRFLTAILGEIENPIDSTE